MDVALGRPKQINNGIEPYIICDYTINQLKYRGERNTDPLR